MNNRKLFAKINTILPKMDIAKFCVIFLAIPLHKSVHCYPQGVAADKCDTLSPTRTNMLATQSFDAKYILLQTAISYKPGQVINVNIQRQASHATFEGFIVQAVDKMTGRYIGRFLDADGLYLMDECSAVTNRDNKLKTFVHLAWVAPLNKIGDVVFRGTIIERKNKYFENLISRLEAPIRRSKWLKLQI